MSEEDQNAELFQKMMREAAARQEQLEAERAAEQQAAVEAEEAKRQAQAVENAEAMASAGMAAVQDEAEQENAERDALAASLAVIAAENAKVKSGEPLPVADVVEGPEGGFGPTLILELRAAGADSYPITYSRDRIVFSSTVTPEQRAVVMAVVEAHDPRASDMPQQRQAAFDTAMAFGNRITDQVENKWSNVERASFTAQEIEAKAIVAGETLADDAMLPILAQHKGITPVKYAQQVLDNAATYRKLAIAAVILRRGADGLLDASLDTPEKLSAAMSQLREQAAQFCEQFGLKME